jgi:hypothetical protein
MKLKTVMKLKKMKKVTKVKMAKMVKTVKMAKTVKKAKTAKAKTAKPAKKTKTAKPAKKAKMSMMMQPMLMMSAKRKETDMVGRVSWPVTAENLENGATLFRSAAASFRKIERLQLTDGQALVDGSLEVESSVPRLPRQPSKPSLRSQADGTPRSLERPRVAQPKGRNLRQ